MSVKYTIVSLVNKCDNYVSLDNTNVKCDMLGKGILL